MYGLIRYYLTLLCILPCLVFAQHSVEELSECEAEVVSQESCVTQKKSKYKILRSPYTLADDKLPKNSERLLPDQEYILWTSNANHFRPEDDDAILLKGEAIPNIQFASDDLNIPDLITQKLRTVIEKLEDKENIRLHIVAYTDNRLLDLSARTRYGSLKNLSRVRAQQAALYFQDKLKLTKDAISFEGRGATNPIADNNTEQGRKLNRRIEIQVWHKNSQQVDQQATVDFDPGLKRIKICRTQERCIFKRKAGMTKRVQLKNTVPVLRYDNPEFKVPDAYIEKVRNAVNRVKQHRNLIIKVTGFSDNLPLSASFSDLYGDKQALTYVAAENVAGLIQQSLNLRNSNISVEGKGGEQPIATNATASGRALNRRVEIEIWYDDPDDPLPSEPKLCPGDGQAEMVTLKHDEKPVVFFKNGEPNYAIDLIQRVKGVLDKLSDKTNVRINFVGHTSNERLNRRAAMVYGSHKGLSESRAERVMNYIQSELDLPDKSVLSEGRGFLEPYADTSASPFARKSFFTIESNQTNSVNVLDARVELEFLYDELAELEQDPSIDIVRVQQEEQAVSPFMLHPIRITVDGQSIDDSRIHGADVQRCTDVALSEAQLRISYDNLKSTPRLNVHATPSTVSYADDKTTTYAENVITFTAYTNYGAYIDRAEVRVFDGDQSSQTEPLAVIQLNQDLRAEWWWIPEIEKFEGPFKELSYILRVYNAQGLFDETRAKRIWVVNERKLTDDALAQDQVSEEMVGYGQSMLAFSNIPVKGSLVTIIGESIPQGHDVWMMDQPVPVDINGRFAVEQILPEGLHSVELSVLDSQGNGELYMRDFSFDKSDWFYVGMADITVGIDNTNGPARLVTQDETHFNNDTFIDGHLAFYTKGKTEGGYTITASADTLEEPIKDLFSNFMDKNPDAVFRRLDPDYFYPTYGDDSTVVDDAPTKGKFYVKAEKNKSYAMWGNFETKIHDTDLAQIDRSLYGINTHIESLDVTEYGENTHEIDIFVAEPGTIQQRDEFRGTGGSLYFLRRRDITVGSDRARIEVRDKDSGIVLQVRNLIPNQDYDFDYIQGRVLLSEPLASTADDGLLVQGGGLNGHPVFLVVRYEYTPGFEELDDVSIGGRFSKWFGEHVKLGTTFSNQEQLGDEHKLAAIDFTLRASASSYIKVEAANSEGPAQNEIFSNDGGFQFNQLIDPVDPRVPANAYRFEAAGSLSDVYKKLQGNATFYMEERDAGYSAPGQYTLLNTSLLGGSFRTSVTKKVDLFTKFDTREREQGLHTRAAEVDAYYRFNNHWRFSAGLRMDSRKDFSLVVPVTQTQGERTDLAVEARYDAQQDWSAYGFVQSTIDVTETRDNNDRTGVGGVYQVTDRLKIDAEVSAGDGGSGAKIGTDYLFTDRTNLYFSYLLEPERSDTGLRGRNGKSVLGFRSRYSDSLSIYGEERYLFGDIPTGLTHAYGLDLAPSDKWLLGFSAELGTLEDNDSGAEIDRTAYGFRGTYGSDKLQFSTVLEYREDINDVAERKTTLLKNTLNYQVSPSWRLVSKYNASDSVSSQGEFYDGNFKEFVLGYAYRPVTNDKLNALIKYTLFENLPVTDQLSTNGLRQDFIQKSNIYAFDVSYDLTSKLSIGAKYAVRAGEVAIERVNPQFFESDARLTVVRADWHIVKKWDILAEVRELKVIQAQDKRSGALLGVYRHIGNNIKVGAGYNFTDFSDDLTDLDFDSQGIFINVIGKL